MAGKAKRQLTPEERKALGERLKAGRAAKAARSRATSERMTAQHAEDRAEVAKIVRDIADPTLHPDNLRLRREAEEQFPAQEIVYGEPEEAEAPDEPECDLNDPFQLFLITLDADTRELLSEDDLRGIYAEQLAKALAEKKAAKKKAATEIALNAARMEAGLVPRSTVEAMEVARRNAELVSMLVELPPSGDNGEIPDIGLRIDQKVYLHGHRYTFTYAQAASYREIMYRAAQMELEFKGQNTRQRRWMLGRTMGMGTTPHVNLNPDGSLA